jgi:hemerythrin HHE cation binding domain-containing protein
MNDITALILDDHDAMRRGFAALDDAAGEDQQSQVWSALSALLELHAAAEEAVFYPQLLHHGGDPEDETRDAIGDHNDIRDAVSAAAQAPVGSDGWWSAVSQARSANSEHMAEEEDGALRDFRRHASTDLRAELAAQFLAFKAEHPGGQGADLSDKDPDDYIAEHE